MEFIEISNNDITTRYFNYNNKILTRTRDDNTGNYLIFKEHLSKKEKQFKNIYGGNGDLSNISASFLLKFPTAKYSDFMQNKHLKGQLLSVFKSFDSTSVLSTFEIDTSAPNETELSIYITISWLTSDINSENKANTLISMIKNSADLINLFSTLPVSSPFDNVILDTSLEPLTIDMFVTSTIHSLVTNYNSNTYNTDIEVKTVGLYDHIGIKINTENDNEYRRLRNNNINNINITNIDPTEDSIIATLFDRDYKKLYTFIQSPPVYIQQTQGVNGDLLNETVDGSITLNLNYDDFITNNQSDFINTINSHTGGHTIIINVYQGSAIVQYRVIFDTSKTQQDINNIITKLRSNTEIQNIINSSSTMNGVTAIQTTGTTATRLGEKLVKTAGIIGIRYDNVNTKLIFKTVGSYQSISYKATGQAAYLSTATKTVDIPIGFTNQVDVKLVDISGNDITTEKTYTLDLISPTITLNGDAQITVIIGDTYVEQGATVSDNSGNSITPVITGTVDVNTIGTYTITYTATDNSGNVSSITRTVVVQEITGKLTYDPANITFTYNAATTGAAPPVYTNGNLIIQKWSAITISSTWLNSESFSYNAPWTFIFVVKNNAPSFIVSYEIDPPLTNWGTNHNGEGDGVIYAYTRSNSYLLGFAEISYNYTNYQNAINNDGVYVVINYDSSQFVNITISSVSNETIVYQLKSINPYTYTNNDTPFSIYHNDITCELLYGMLYDNTGTATINDYKTMFNL